MVEQGLLHHVGHLVALETWPDDDDRPHAGHHVVGRDGLDLAQQALLLLLALHQGAPSPGGLRGLHRLWRRSHLLTILVDRHLRRALLLVHEPAHLGAGVLCLVGVHLGGLVLSELDPQVLQLGGGGDEADLTALLHPSTDPPVGIVPLHHVEVVAHPEADGGPMDGGVVVKGAIEGDVGLDGEDHRLGASFLELEQSLAFRVSSEVLSFLVQAGETQLDQRFRQHPVFHAHHSVKIIKQRHLISSNRILFLILSIVKYLTRP